MEVNVADDGLRRTPSSSPPGREQRPKRRPLGRLAPSPTGPLHLGHARSFLLAWWHARSQGGRVVLRLEDLDGERSSQEHIDTVLRDLEWLGLDWDGTPLLQSAGIERLMGYAIELQRKGLAYPCTCSRAEIRSASNAPHGSEGEDRYPGTCRGRFASLAQARAETGREPGLRFLVPPGERIVEDGFAGVRRYDPAQEVGDFLIARRNGSPAYQLAVVVDDMLAGVTEVLRGDDLLPSTARQLLLFEALGEKPPAYYHVPLVCDATGRRLAKREKDLSLRDLREAGVDPRAVVEWVAHCSGFVDVQRPRAIDLVTEFALERVPKTPVRVLPDDLERIRAAR